MDYGPALVPLPRSLMCGTHEDQVRTHMDVCGARGHAKAAQIWGWKWRTHGQMRGHDSFVSVGPCLSGHTESDKHIPFASCVVSLTHDREQTGEVARIGAETNKPPLPARLMGFS
jgi:hypothetical protein